MITDRTDDKAGQPVVAWLIRTGKGRREMSEFIKFALMYFAGIMLSGLGVALTINGVLMILKGLKVLP